MKHAAPKLIRESYGDTLYEYYSLGQYIVAAPGVCGGRPTFKYSRLEVATILDLLAIGWTVEQIIEEYDQSQITAEAIAEAVRLAKEALVNTAATIHPAA